MGVRRTCNKELRDAILETYKTNDIRFLRFLRYLFFTSKRDNQFNPIINRGILASCAGKKNDDNFNGESFLIEFRSIMPDLTWSKWSKKEGRARVAYFHIPSNISSLLHSEIGDVVDFITGEKWSYKKELKLRKEYEEITGSIGSHYAKELLNYFNSMPANIFTKLIQENFDEAFKMVLEIEDESVRSHQVGVFYAIREQVKPFYQPSKEQKSVRIFPLNSSILSLKRNLRKRICKGLVEFDLRSAQLAIIAKLWKIASLTDFLKSGKSIWEELGGYFDDKDEAKKFLYALIFGMSKKNLAKLCNDNSVFSHYLIVDILLARKEQLKEKTRSELACEAQKVEMDLLLPVLQVPMRDFKLCLWQHDGFSIYTKKMSVINRLCKIVNDNAKKMNIITELEFEIL